MNPIKAANRINKYCQKQKCSIDGITIGQFKKLFPKAKLKRLQEKLPLIKKHIENLTREPSIYEEFEACINFHFPDLTIEKDSEDSYTYRITFPTTKPKPKKVKKVNK
jgi:hypothetical protein